MKGKIKGRKQEDTKGGGVGDRRGGGRRGRGRRRGGLRRRGDESYWWVQKIGSGIVSR
jgi:hypothetical protein